MSLNSGETLQPFKPLNQLIFDSSGNLVGIQNDRANGSDLRIGGGSGVDGTFATLVATTALTLNAGATFNLYNTADQTTNYERLRADYSSNVARLWTGYGGSASARALRLGVSSVAGASSPNIGLALSGTSPLVSLGGFGGSVSSTSTLTNLSDWTANASSGTQTLTSVAPTINQSGTAGYTAFDINPTETATGSGTKLLQRWAVGGTALAYITNQGGINTATGVASVTGYFFNSALGAGADLSIVRDAADTLAQRRGTVAQAFRVYKTYTDASNYERLDINWSGSQCFIGAAFAGTGVGRELQFVSYGSAAFTLTATAHVALAAGTTARSQINFASSTAPTSPADGDLWFDGTNLKLRVSGTTYTLTKV